MQGVRSKPSKAALIGGRSNRLRCGAAMREHEPGRQLAGGLLGGLAVEGHHGRRHARLPGQLGAPAVADRRHFNLVRTPGDGFFEMVNHLSGGFDLSIRSAADFTRSSRAIKRRRSRRPRPQPPVSAIVGRSERRKMCAVGLSTRFARLVHSFSTAQLSLTKRCPPQGLGR
jgi:hypothetical protein